MNTLWYNSPAKDWNSALPVGNGRIGAMVFGNTSHEIIQLNEESVWSGSFKNRNNPDCFSNLKNVRNLISEGKLLEAQNLAYNSMTGTPANESVYQTAGELRIDFFTDNTKGLPVSFPLQHYAFEEYSCYRRELDLETAVATTSFTTESIIPSTADFSSHSKGSSISYTREVFASAPDNVLVIHLSASVPRSISFVASLDRGIWATKVFGISDDTIALQDTHGIPFCVMATALASGGITRTVGGKIIVEGADEVTIFVDIQTAFRNKKYRRRKGISVKKANSLAAWCTEAALKNICMATGASYPDLKLNHIEDYSFYYKNTELHLTENSDAEKIPTDELVKQIENPALAELYWNYGRYLLISCSREPGTLPATLQGLWCKDIEPAWGSKYTININTEMNYWASNMCSLSKTELPLFNLLERMHKNGMKTARTMYGCDGYVAHHNTDIWGDTAPQDEWMPGTYWLLGAAWLATHVREHYEYTLDKKFLWKYFYLLRDCCRFFADFLIPSEDGKYLVLSPSVSPENSYRLPNGQVGAFCSGCEMDNRILEQLFTATINTSEELNFKLTTAEIIQFRAIRQKLMPPVVTKENTIREWNFECEEVEPGHRHISQLYGLFPGHTITVTRTPVLAQAAHNTIEKRLANGGGHTGWSQAWILNFRASLHEKEEAYKSLTALFEKSTLPNLFDNHPPFQIDGNFGALAGITRMLVQSDMLDDSVEIALLPALPEKWQNGNIKGICLKGNLRCDLEWKNGVISAGKIYAMPGSEFIKNMIICYAGKRYEAHIEDEAVDIMNILPTTV